MGLFRNLWNKGKAGTKTSPLPGGLEEGRTAKAVCRRGGVAEIASVARGVQHDWSPRSGLNRRPAAYKAAALPLSYEGKSRPNEC